MPDIGSIAWVDLTVPNAEEVRDFYRDVVGWSSEDLDMGEYSDFVMRSPASGEAVAGVCHARGVNAGLPPQWLVYLTVADLDQSLARCTEKGGRLRGEPFDMGSFGRMCLVEDPAGAVAALIQPPG